MRHRLKAGGRSELMRDPAGWDFPGLWFHREPDRNRLPHLDQLSYARPPAAQNPAKNCQDEQDDANPQQETESLVESSNQEQDDRNNTGDYQECVH